MAQAITLSEIQMQFAGEWILAGDPRTDQTLEVQCGHVLYHSKDRDEVHREAVALRPLRFAILYTGDMPPDTAIVL